MDPIYEREEYEMSLYGFSLKDFKRENFQFFRNQLKKSMLFIKSKFLDLMKSGRNDTVENLRNALSQVEINILESTKSNIQHIANDEVGTSLKIPDNVILPTDRAQVKPFTSECIETLEKECDELSLTVLQNASFIKLLSNELINYNLKDLLDHENQVIMQGEKFLSMQLLNSELVTDEEEIDENMQVEFE